MPPGPFSHYGFTVDDGPVAACPDGNGFKARFEHFQVKHLPDLRRLEWLEANK